MHHLPGKAGLGYVHPEHSIACEQQSSNICDGIPLEDHPDAKSLFRFIVTSHLYNAHKLQLVSVVATDRSPW